MEAFSLQELEVAARICADRKFSPAEWRAAALAHGFIEKVNARIQQAQQQQDEAPEAPPEGDGGKDEDDGEPSDTGAV